MPTPNDFSDVQLSSSQGRMGGQTLSKMSGDPVELLEETKSEVAKHGDLLSVYGYKMPVATLGSHPWLRDGLANQTELEPGNAEPEPGLKIPFGGNR